MSDRLTYNGEDDYLPDDALNNILETAKLIPEEYTHEIITATPGSVSMWFDFGADTKGDQILALAAVLHASTVVGTLARNLRYEREKNA